MEIYVMPSWEVIIMQLMSLLIVGVATYLCFLLIKALKLYIKNKS